MTDNTVTIAGNVDCTTDVARDHTSARARTIRLVIMSSRVSVAIKICPGTATRECPKRKCDGALHRRREEGRH